MPRRFSFDRDKALEAIIYVARGVRQPTFHTISKVLYFADQKHLRDFGRLICGDHYVAMRHGPVPSGAYDLLKFVRDGAVLADGFAERLAAGFAVTNKCEVHARRGPVLDALSESDRSALNWAIEEFGSRSFKYLTDKSHDAAWRSADENDMIELSAIVDLQPNAAELREHLELEAGN
jgi:uncharacterized phage-associated protein